ncbi:MAG: hypothetical protein FWG25_00835 [Promicromonosporaceae bacterium]|nr:hypothetical protein [Promicromonosporaceae bacterium]
MTTTPASAPPEATEAMTAEVYADIITTVPDTQALAAQSLSLRTGAAASRDSVRAAVPDLAATALETTVGDVLLTVHVTPAPIPCAFTGLTHLAFDDALCTTPSNNTPEQNQALGRYLAALRGWDGNQFQCLDNLITRESRWRHTAANPVTSARGIPQKMMSVHYGANWSTSPVAAEWLANPEPQIEWGLDYIARRYSDPCGAWGFFQRNGWY